MSTSKPYILEIPEDVLDEARIPKSERESTLKREVAIHLYARGILPRPPPAGSPAFPASKRTDKAPHPPASARLLSSPRSR